MLPACKTANYGQLQGINCVRSCGQGLRASVLKSLRSCTSVPGLAATPICSTRPGIGHSAARPAHSRRHAFQVPRDEALFAAGSGHSSPKARCAPWCGVCGSRAAAAGCEPILGFKVFPRASSFFVRACVVRPHKLELRGKLCAAELARPPPLGDGLRER